MKKFIILLILASIIVFSSLSIFADIPVFDGSPTLTLPFGSNERQKLVDCVLAEQALSVFRVNSYLPVLLAVYSVDQGNNYQYYYALVAHDHISVSLSGISEAGLTTSFNVSNYGYCHVYGFRDTSDGGFVHSSALTTSTISCSSVLWYAESSRDNAVVHNLTLIPSTQLGGNASFVSNCAQSWIDAYIVKVNGITDNYVVGYNDGYFDGIEEGISQGYDIGYESGYNDAISDPDLFDSVYDMAFQDGYETGWGDGYREGFSDGYDTGFESGVASVQTGPAAPGDRSLAYQEGLSDGIKSVSTLSSFLTSIPSGILHAFIEMLDIELWGIKLYVPFIAIIVLFVVLAIWGIIRRVTGH